MPRSNSTSTGSQFQPSDRRTRRLRGATLTIVVAVLVLRAPALLQSVTGADEGLYALVAREWVNGHLPYTTVWETKPPLFFALLAIAMLALGKSILAVRLANDVAIAVTASALYALGASLRRGGHVVGITAALLYAAMTISDSGLSAVAETFYTPFIAVPLAIVLRGPWTATHRGLRLVMLGTCLGCAVLVKESALPEVAYVAAVVIWAWELAALAPLALGFALALTASFMPYAATRNVAPYWDANVGAVVRRAFVRIPDVTPWMDVVRAQLLAFFPATLLVFGVPWVWRADDTDHEERGLIVTMVGWTIVCLLAVVLLREYLGNHFIPAMAPASVLAALVTVRVGERLRAPRFVPAVVLLALLAHASYQFVLAAPVLYGRLESHDPAFGDPTAEIARYLVDHQSPPRSLYVADDRTVLYVLTGTAPPTRYAYPPHLLDRYQEIVAGVDGPHEIVRVLSTHPFFIIRDAANRAHEDPRGRRLLDTTLGSTYHAVFGIRSRAVFAPTETESP